jgi:aspartate aminotransferase
MELVILGVSDPNDRPILLIDPIYTNYLMLAHRTSRKTISIQRKLDVSGHFSFPTVDEIDDMITIHNPSAIVIIPYDNPTGQLYDRQILKMIA